MNKFFVSFGFQKFDDDEPISFANTYIAFLGDLTEYQIREMHDTIKRRNDYHTVVVLNVVRVEG